MKYFNLVEQSASLENRELISSAINSGKLFGNLFLLLDLFSNRIWQFSINLTNHYLNSIKCFLFQCLFHHHVYNFLSTTHLNVNNIFFFSFLSFIWIYLDIRNIYCSKSNFLKFTYLPSLLIFP